VDELFSCRNCIHNAGQSLNIGRGAGYCLKHESVLYDPERTTCKYLHRKDLPRFVVEEGIREHAAEFATFSGLVSLETRQPIPPKNYSERFVWERGTFDPLMHALAQYYKLKPSWVFVQALSGGLDGRRSIAHAGLVRRYMDKCGTWKSSCRLVLGLLQELPTEPHFTDGDLKIVSDGSEVARSEAIWDVIFARLAGLQEYGFHSGIERLMWATDELNGGLSSLDWGALAPELHERQPEWTELIVQHASDEGVFFPTQDSKPDEEDDPEAP
jgi:hypothetical protein